VDEPEEELPVGIAAPPTSEMEEPDLKLGEGDSGKKSLDQA
jgi:hypothetical protein